MLDNIKNAMKYRKVQKTVGIVISLLVLIIWKNVRDNPVIQEWDITNLDTIKEIVYSVFGWKDFGGKEILTCTLPAIFTICGFSLNPFFQSIKKAIFFVIYGFEVKLKIVNPNRYISRRYLLWAKDFCMILVIVAIIIFDIYSYCYLLKFSMIFRNSFDKKVYVILVAVCIQIVLAQLFNKLEHVYGKIGYFVILSCLFLVEILLSCQDKHVINFSFFVISCIHLVILKYLLSKHLSFFRDNILSLLIKSCFYGIWLFDIYVLQIPINNSDSICWLLLTVVIHLVLLDRPYIDDELVNKIEFDNGEIFEIEGEIIQCSDSIIVVYQRKSKEKYYYNMDTVLRITNCQKRDISITNYANMKREYVISYKRGDKVVVEGDSISSMNEWIWIASNDEKNRVVNIFNVNHINNFLPKK